MDPTGRPSLSKYVEIRRDSKHGPPRLCSGQNGAEQASPAPEVARGGQPRKPRPISAAWAALAAAIPNLPIYLGYTGRVCHIGAKPDFVTERWIDGDDRLNQVTSHNGVAFTRLFDRV